MSQLPPPELPVPQFTGGKCWEPSRHATFHMSHVPSVASNNTQPVTVNIPSQQTKTVGRDSSVGITTGYGLDGPGIESRWGRDFPHPS
jgi:hypothetical protein